MKIELASERIEEKKGFEVIDVTTFAARICLAIPGWRVQLTRQVWDEYVGVPGDCRPGDSVRLRLSDLCVNLWIALLSAKHPADWALGGFDLGIGVLRWHIDSSTPRPERRQFPVEVRLEVAAIIARNGSPALLVFSARDHFDRRDYAAAREVK